MTSDTLNNMYNIKLLLFIFIIACFYTISMAQMCSLTIPTNKLNVPIFEISFGTKKLKISSLIPNQITLINGESITGYCATKFSPFSYYRPRTDENTNENENRYYYQTTLPPPPEEDFVFNAQNVSLKCIDGKVLYYVKEHSEYLELAEKYLSCEDYEWSIYEAINPFYWCTSKATSYNLVTTSMGDKIILAAVCYNLENMSLESIRYTTTRKNYILNQENLSMLHSSELILKLQGVEIEHYSLFAANDNLRQATNFENVQNKFLQVAMYRSDLLVQNGPYEDFLLKYGKFLEVTWWHNLLHGNWKQITEAFSQQMANVTYDVFMGVSGTIKTPYYSECKEWKMQSIKNTQHNETVPAYIWAYLRTFNGSEQIVIIGYNSPFFDFFDPSEIIFCKSICNEISWLEGISSTFNYSALGVVFCCTPEAVRNAGFLNGFPEEKHLMGLNTQLFGDNFTYNLDDYPENNAENVIQSIEDDYD